NTTFVAHNVNFDYSFLSSELERAGYPELELPMMDTVQLTQIIYPTLVSYRLIDVSKYLQLSHIHPHKADSDTKATAELLINLNRKSTRLNSSHVSISYAVFCLKKKKLLIALL